MKHKKRLFALLLTAFLLCALPMTAFAQETLDKSRAGAITVEMEYDGEAVSGGALSAYLVGLIQGDSFLKTDSMETFDGDYDDVGSAKLAEDMDVFVKTNNLSAYAEAENKDGKAVFTNLESGLYLIVQTQASEGYEPLKAFLVSVPMNENGHFVYEINAKGKFQLHQEPEPEPPFEPDINTDRTLPQTGQLNWPVPLLAVLGLTMFSIGWALRFGRKRGDE